jgi:transcriptional regulator with XRE-family HTH domain
MIRRRTARNRWKKNMQPDATKHNPDPLYLRELIARTGLSQSECARRLGISPRQMRAYLTFVEKKTPAPYPVQFALECLAESLEEEEPVVIDDTSSTCLRSKQEEP